MSVAGCCKAPLAAAVAQGALKVIASDHFTGPAVFAERAVSADEHRIDFAAGRDTWLTGLDASWTIGFALREGSCPVQLPPRGPCSPSLACHCRRRFLSVRKTLTPSLSSPISKRAGKACNDP